MGGDLGPGPRGDRRSLLCRARESRLHVAPSPEWPVKSVLLVLFPFCRQGSGGHESVFM